MPDRKLSARYPTDLPAWQKLKSHYKDDMKKRHIGDLFKSDAQRAGKSRLTIRPGADQVPLVRLSVKWMNLRI